ncbi:MAG TPA: hypothetical protein PKK40_06730, partial [Marmoricola sp.]|nr:hypothetical protein [Marmoricola sp.]
PCRAMAAMPDSSAMRAIVVRQSLKSQRPWASPSPRSTSATPNRSAVVAEIAEIYGHCEQDRLDGLTVSTADWWFNVRASNTEPLLRLNVEGCDQATMTNVRDEVLALIRKDAS